ncbi:MAG: precorrin-3B C(17)-methyltransferase [Desulfovibrio sp.]|jgi:precorrin-3B C17-methyltransferase|nr:precorrin-3B C(17)-methyltransferase [Desulfovibrio sp.]
MSAAPLYVVGLGPGDAACLTPQAREALGRARCLAGYHLYLELVPPELLTGKRLVATGMRREEERCVAAVDAALSGESSALVCSGDPGVYALAGLALEVLEARNLLECVPFHVVPGIPAVCAAASLLGAPLTHDFACVSLSDLLTPWRTIEKRLEAAFAADFVCVLYNPRSRGRPHLLGEALSLAGNHRSPDCPVGLVRKAFRPGQEVGVHKLADLDVEKVDMLSLLVVGNCASRLVGGRFMLTPRGYRPQRRS